MSLPRTKAGPILRLQRLNLPKEFVSGGEEPEGFIRLPGIA
jgi:hypothetical protein